MDTKDIVSTLGELKGITLSMNQRLLNMDSKIDKIDERLRIVEQRSIRNGLVGGALISGIINVGLKLFGMKMS